jgi:hypothetical protein
VAIIEGVRLNLGGRDFVVPPLTLKSLRKMANRLSALRTMGDIPTDDEVEVVVEIVHAAMVRNYPDLTTDDVEELMDMANLKSVMLAVLQGSGLSRSAPGEAEESRASTGPASTDS